MPPEYDITGLLLDLQAGQREVMDRLFPLVYEELHRLAHQRRVRQGAGQTLNTTALVHEAYLKLIDQSRVLWQDRVHFFAVAARAMRFILVDDARRRDAQKRGGNLVRVPLDEISLVADEKTAGLLALDEALDHLAERDERLAQVVECRFFGGMTTEETAMVLGTSTRTVKRDWQKARLLLYRDLHANA